MAKLHLRRNKITETTESMVAICATKSIGNGMFRKNDRATYRFMSSEIVGPEEFRAAAFEVRCMHCNDMGLALRNLQRKNKGLPPVASF